MSSLKTNAGIRVQYADTQYIKGEGVKKTWIDFKYYMGDSEYCVFPVRWVNAFGNEAITAESLNIKQLATVRMGYNPKLYNTLCSKQIRIFLNDEKDEKQAYSMYGSCDNIRMENKQIEFKVHRVEVK